VLGGLTLAERRRFASFAERLTVPRRTLLFSQGDVGQHFYLVESGSVRVFYHARMGREPTIGYCHPGQLFGLAELSAAGRRVASAEAAEASSVWAIENRRLRDIAVRIPSLSLRIIEALSLRLRAVTLLMESVVTLPVGERVANFLLAHAKPQPARPGAVVRAGTHEDIADMLGCTRPTVTEVLNDLARAGLIEIQRKHITIVDARRLGARAGVDDGGHDRADDLSARRQTRPGRQA
jgi:CRP/FNR family transcriptional regulator